MINYKLKINDSKAEFLIIRSQFSKVALPNLTVTVGKGVFKGGGVQGVQTPPPRNFQIFLKSEGKEIERKKMRRDGRGGGVNC